MYIYIYIYISNNNGTNTKTCGTPIKMSSKVQYRPCSNLSEMYYHTTMVTGIKTFVLFLSRIY